MKRWTSFGSLVAAALVITACSGNDASEPTSSPQTGSGGQGTAAGGSTGTGGAAGGTAPGGAGTGGVVNLPPGELVCGGVQCHGGGHCSADGSCPPFLSDCFASTDGLDTCDAYCRDRGYLCAEKGCGMDGTALSGGFTWTSYTPDHQATCTTSPASDHAGQSACGGVLWLTLSTDEVVRCCCKQ
ncbi:MAG TPA: hypothetical protein VHE30_16735 [Polyangiaceae bacterium]|nr:hypothetical protein [Polyangiaceae bacterium]